MPLENDNKVEARGRARTIRNSETWEPFGIADGLGRRSVCTQDLTKVGTAKIIVPWFSSLFEASILTEGASKPVPGVECKLSRLLKPGEEDPRYTNFLTATSDDFGLCKFDISVADRTWNAERQ